MDISVIIPVYNDPRGLRTTVESVINQKHANFELIIVDNNSVDDTGNVAEYYEEQYPDYISVYYERDVQSSYAARNCGIRNSKGEVLCFIDADMSAEPEWLFKLNDRFKNKEVQYSGSNVNIYSEGLDETLSGIYNKRSGFPVERYVSDHNFAPTCCLSVRKSVFDEVGLFNSDLISGGDWEFGNRVSENGITQHYFPNIVLNHPARTNLASLMSKYKRVGVGHQQMNQLGIKQYRSLAHPIHYLPPHPITFKQRVISDTDGWSTILGLYFVGYLTKLSKLYGRLTQVV